MKIEGVGWQTIMTKYKSRKRNYIKSLKGYYKKTIGIEEYQDRNIISDWKPKLFNVIFMIFFLSLAFRSLKLLLLVVQLPQYVVQFHLGLLIFYFVWHCYCRTISNWYQLLSHVVNCRAINYPPSIVVKYEWWKHQKYL